MTRENRTRAMLWTLLALTLLRMPLALALRMLLPDASVSPESNYAASLLQSLLLFALPGWLLTPARRREPQKAAETLKWVPLCLLAAVLARAVATPLNAWWAELLGAPAIALPPAEGPLATALLLLAAVVIPAIAEEMFFRGALLTNLLQSGSRTQAAALTTLMFALLHGSVAGLPGHLIISLLLTLLMLHTGHLALPISAHMLFNALALCWPECGHIVPWIAGGLLAGLTGFLALRLPQGRTRSLPKAEGILCAAILLLMAAQYLF